ncbi:50S ribosome-binding GTPase [Popillia japonica]|uniref:Large subunit GTPase 1 homolog n=1 Tax=Popillia japonica TaxID=7064 RepID=A0AAW1K4Z4_POPJA
MVDGSMLHTTEIQDGYNWGRLNLQSVTEESSFQEFLATAELAGTEFQAEKLNIKFFNPKNYIGLLNKEEKQKVKEKFQANKDSIKIPRRPPWSIGVTTEELHAKERDSFLEWRKSLAVLEEEKGILLTPYEKNIEFWRQLWRVLERSDVVVQIVDARNPLLFWCEDLNTYVKEISKDKLNLILLNKADYLTENQRHYWANYFSSIGIQVAFFSAILASDADTFNENHITNNQNLSDIKRKVEELELSVEKTADSLSKILNTVNKFIETKIPNSDKLDLTSLAIDNSLNQNTLCNYQNSSKILSRTELISYLKNIHKLQSVGNNVVTIGLVGYPNVGKSSTINALMTVKKMMTYYSVIVLD